MRKELLDGGVQLRAKEGELAPEWWVGSSHTGRVKRCWLCFVISNVVRA